MQHKTIITPKNLRIYFISTLIISLIITFFGNDTLDNYATVFYMLTGPPIFTIIQIKYNSKLNLQLKENYNEIYEKFKESRGYSKSEGIWSLNIINRSDNTFEKSLLETKNSELINIYFIIKHSITFTYLSFFLIIPIALCLFIKIHFFKL